MYETVFRSRQAPESWDPSEGDVVDLHGYTAGVAKAAIRSGLKTLLRRFLTAGESSLEQIMRESSQMVYGETPPLFSIRKRLNCSLVKHLI